MSNMQITFTLDSRHIDPLPCPSPQLIQALLDQKAGAEELGKAFCLAFESALESRTGLKANNSLSHTTTSESLLRAALSLVLGTVLNRLRSLLPELPI